MEQLWREQCEAAVGIREDYGWQKALGYLVGEKLMNHARDLGRSPEAEQRLERMAADVRGIFPEEELSNYFRTVKRVGVLGHVVDDETYRFLGERGVVNEDPAEMAQDVLLLERLRKLIMTAPQ